MRLLRSTIKFNFATIQWKIGKMAKLSIASWKILHNCAFGTFFFLLWFGSATVASSSQWAMPSLFLHFALFLQITWMVFYTLQFLLETAAYHYRNVPIEKIMLIVKMQLSKKWHKKIVNQDIPFLVIVSAQKATTFGYSSKKNRTSHCQQ